MTPVSVVEVTTPQPSAAGGPTPARSRTAKWLISMVRGYQLARAGRPSGCRFIPSCSEYAIGAVGVHGTFRGSALAARRLLRCHPWGGHGVDPVPDEGDSCNR